MPIFLCYILRFFMWINKFLATLSVLALLIFAGRVLLGKQQKQALHELVQIMAKVLLIVALFSAIFLIYQRIYAQ